MGRAIERAVAVVGMSHDEARDALTRLLSDSGYRVAPLGPNSIQLAKAKRPTWAVFAAVVFALPTLGMSLLLLLIANTELSSAVFDDGPKGLRVHLSGQLPAAVVTGIQGVLTRQPRDRPGEVLDLTRAPPQWSPEPTVDAGLDAWQPIQVAGAVAAAPSPAADLYVDGHPSVGASSHEVYATVARPARLARTLLPEATDGPMLAFDTGERVRASSCGFVGRDPSADQADPAPQLVAIDDPDRSLSKSHLAFGVDASGLWVADQFSMNGSAVTDASGLRVECVPGERRYVQPGSTVHIGARAFTVMTAALGSSLPRPLT